MRRVLAAVAVAAAVLAGALATPASAAPAKPARAATTHTLYESYYCGDGTYSNGNTYRTCHGNWANGNPTRSLQLWIIVNDDVNGYQYQEPQEIYESDGRSYTGYVHCRQANGSLSGVVDTWHIGGSVGADYKWHSGYIPCSGTDVGLAVSLYSIYGGVQYNSWITYDDNQVTNQAGYQNGWPETYA